MNGERGLPDKMFLSEVYIISQLCSCLPKHFSSNSSTAFIIFLSENISFCGQYDSATDFGHSEPDVAFIFKERALTEILEQEQETSPWRLTEKYENRRIKTEEQQRKWRGRVVAEKQKQAQKEREKKVREQAKVFKAKMEEAEKARKSREYFEATNKKINEKAQKGREKAQAIAEKQQDNLALEEARRHAKDRAEALKAAEARNLEANKVGMKMRDEEPKLEQASQGALARNEAQRRKHDKEREKVKRKLTKQGGVDWYGNDSELPTPDGTAEGMREKSLWKRLKYHYRNR